MSAAGTGTETVDGVPLLWNAPESPTAILIHVPAFGQPKERAQPVLDYALARSFAALAIDSYQQGARGSEDRDALTRRVFGNFRREMWTILGETTLDVPRIAAWARARFGATLPIHLTGLSAGGDIVVAAAPLVERVASVNAVIATPDWTRPGMRDIGSGELIPPGVPDAKAQLFFDHLQPVAYPARYRQLRVHFIVGENDTHVPPEAAFRFQALVNEGRGTFPIRVTQKPGMAHLDFVAGTWIEDLRF